MQQRVPLLFVTGALAFGTLGYFLFLYDDGTAAKPSPIAHAPTRRINTLKPDASSGVPTASAPATSEAPPANIATTPAPTTTGPPE